MLQRQPQHRRQRGDGVLVAPRGERDRLGLVVRFDVVGVGREDLAQVLQRFLVEPVLDVDLGLLEQLGHRGRGGRSGGAGGGRNRRRRRPRRLDRRGRRPDRLPGLDGTGRRPRRRGRNHGHLGDRLRRGTLRSSRFQDRRLLLGLPLVGVLQTFQPLLHLGVVRRQLLRLGIRPPRVLVVAGVDVDPRQLLQHRDGLGDLSQILERLGQHLQRAEVARVRLEADLQLGERSLRVAAAQVTLGQLLGQRDVALVEMADPLGHPQVIVGAAVPLQVLRSAAQLGHRLDQIVLPRVLLAQPDAGGDVIGVEIDQLLQGIEAGFGVADLFVVRRDRLPLFGRVADQSQLLVQLGEADVDLDPIDDLEHLLVERDRFQIEALRRIGLGDLLEAVGRLRLAVHLLVQLGELLQDTDVVRIDLEDPLELLDGLLELTFGDQLRGRLHDLVFVHRSGRLSGSKKVRASAPT